MRLTFFWTFVIAAFASATLPAWIAWSGYAPPFLAGATWLIGVVVLLLSFHPRAIERRASGTGRGARRCLLFAIACLVAYPYALRGLTARPSEREAERVQIGFGMADWSLTPDGKRIAVAEDLHSPSDLLLAIGGFDQEGGRPEELWSRTSIVAAGLILVVLLGVADLLLVLGFLRLARLFAQRGTFLDVPASREGVANDDRPDSRAEGPPARTGLIVLVPGLSADLSAWDPLLERIRAEPEFRGHRCLTWRHQRSWYSRASMSDLALSLDAHIHAEWTHHGPCDEVVLIGHSLGGLLVREAYLLGCGIGPEGTQRRPWADRVRRIVLFAAPNRGIDPATDWRTKAATFASRFPVARGMLVSNLVRGGQFVTNLRLRWIRHFDALGRKAPAVSQLVGDEDGLVKRADSIDVEQFPNATHVTIPKARHDDLYRLEGVEDAELRYALIRAELTRAPSDLTSNDPAPAVNASKCFVFILHGIRAGKDTWVSELARRVIKLDPEVVPVIFDYPRVSAFTFAFPPTRRKHLASFQDMYSQCLAINPRAEFHFIGHSNGTYLLGESLRGLTGMRFQRIALVGSVLPREYGWEARRTANQVVSVANHRSDGDVPVAILCNALRGLRMHDVGTGGFHGFYARPGTWLEEIYWYSGGHSAPLDEAHLDDLANYVLDGKIRKSGALTSKPVKHMALASRLAPWLSAAAALAALYFWGHWIVTPEFSTAKFLWSSAGGAVFVLAAHLF